jgi:opacity protein-like surface antigen
MKMSFKLILAAAILTLMAPLSARAQGVKLYGGYSGATSGSTVGQGFQAQAAFKTIGPFDTVVSYSNMNKPGNQQSVMLGIQLNQRSDKRFSFFEQGLVGVTRTATTVAHSTTFGPLSVANSQFAFSVGAGMDINLNKHLSVRAVKVDYLHAYDTANQVQVGAGVVLKF